MFNLLSLNKDYLTVNAANLLKNGIGYRVEAYGNSGFTDLESVVEFEMLELLNEDIIITLEKLYNFPKIPTKYLDDYENLTKTYTEVINFVKKMLNTQNVKVRWLCDSFESLKQHYWEEGQEIDAYYLVGDIMILSDLGAEGILIASNLEIF